MTAPKRPAPKRPAPKCPRAQTAAPKRRRPEVTYPYSDACETGLNVIYALFPHYLRNEKVCLNLSKE